LRKKSTRPVFGVTIFLYSLTEITTTVSIPKDDCSVKIFDQLIFHKNYIKDGTIAKYQYFNILT